MQFVENRAFPVLLPDDEAEVGLIRSLLGVANLKYHFVNGHLLEPGLELNQQLSTHVLLGMSKVAIKYAAETGEKMPPLLKPNMTGEDLDTYVNMTWASQRMAMERAA